MLFLVLSVMPPNQGTHHLFSCRNRHHIFSATSHPNSSSSLGLPLDATYLTQATRCKVCHVQLTRAAPAYSCCPIGQTPDNRGCFYTAGAHLRSLVYFSGHSACLQTTIPNDFLLWGATKYIDGARFGVYHLALPSKVACPRPWFTRI